MKIKSMTRERAHEIMGKNFFGIKEAVKYFGVNPTHQQLIILSKIPFSKAVLEQLKSSHVLVVVFPLSILEIRGKMRQELQKFSCGRKEAPYDKEFFAKERGGKGSKVNWQLARKTPVDNSFLKRWQKQQVLVAKDDEVPTARVMVYAIVGHYLATGECLLEKIYVRTSSMVGGNRVVVGLSSGSLCIGYCYDDGSFGNLGIASVRKRS